MPSDSAGTSESGSEAVQFVATANSKGDASWPESTSGYLPRGNPCAQCGEPIAAPGMDRKRSAPHLLSLALPGLRLPVRGGGVLRATHRTEPIAAWRPESPWRSGGRLPALLAHRQLNANDQSVRLPVVAATARRHAPARWCARSTGRDRSPAASSMLRASSPRTNGSSMTSLRASEMPGPSSSTSMVTVSGDTPQADRGLRAEPDRVLDQIGDAAMQIVGPHRRHGMFRAVIGDLVSHVGELIGDQLQRGRDIDQRHGFELAVVAQEGEHGFQHRAHLVEIAQHAAAMHVVLDEFGAQPHPGDRRAQIVADRGQHLGAVVDQGGDALPHPVERLGHRADFFRAAFGQRRGGAVQAEILGGLRERRQRRGQGARGPQAEQGDADDGEQQGQSSTVRPRTDAAAGPAGSWRKSSRRPAARCRPCGICRSCASEKIR